MIALIILEEKTIYGYNTVAIFALFKELEAWIERRSWIRGPAQWFMNEKEVVLNQQYTYHWRHVPYYPVGHFDDIDNDEIRC